MSNTITIELCQEDRKRLDKLTDAIAELTNELKSHRPLQLKSIDENGIHFGTAAEDPAEEHPVDAVAPHGEPEPAAEPEQPKYTKADIQAKVQKLAKPGSPKRLEAKAIVKEYAAKVSDIPEDKFAEVMDKLNALEV